MSMRKLRWRLLRWERYCVATGSTGVQWHNPHPIGYWRARFALDEEAHRRRVRTVYWPTGRVP